MADDSTDARLKRQDVLLLGASNLVLGWQSAIRTLRKINAAPLLRLNVAFGMGRSYIRTSAVWFRQLPSINDCALWANLPEDLTQPPLVLITDLGNDIIYLFEPQEIIAAVRRCIQRILSWRSDAKIVITGLPIDSINRIGKIQFVVTRTILFPGCRLPYSAILERSHLLENLAKQLAIEFQLPFVAPESNWYGYDPIHVVPKSRDAAFRKYFTPFNVTPPVTSETEGRPFQHVSLPTAAQRRVFWQDRSVSQPDIHTPEIVVSAW